MARLGVGVSPVCGGNRLGLALSVKHEIGGCAIHAKEECEELEASDGKERPVGLDVVDELADVGASLLKK